MKAVKQSLVALMACVWAMAAQAAGNDELWEISTKVDMPGMPAGMGAVTAKSCLPTGGAYKPEANAQQDKNCKVLDLQVSGNTTRWKIQCSGKDEMTGSGEVTRTATTLNGTMKMNARGMQMNQVIAGRKVGACDAAAERQKVDTMVQGQMKQMCEGLSESAIKTGGVEPRLPEPFTGKGQCAAAKAEVCTKARVFAGSYEGYPAYARNRNGWVMGECGIKLEAVRANLCAQAQGERKYGFLGQSCPAEAKALYDKNCQGFGRGYTADAANPNASLCRALQAKGKGGGSGSIGEADEGMMDRGARPERARKGARAEVMQEAEPAHEPSQADAASQALEAAKNMDVGKAIDSAKKLKGLFGF